MNQQHVPSKRILIIDDEPAITQLMSMLLESRGYKVEVAHCAREAALKCSQQIDLIILDLILPDQDGFELCRTIKGGPSFGHIPVIIVSSRYLCDDKIEGLYLGADDYLTKPFDYEELFARVEAVLRRHAPGAAFDLINKDGDVVQELRRIIKEERIIPYFQPIYDVKQSKILGVEVLCRPQTAGPLANPEILFKAACHYGFYHELETLCWQKALMVILKEQFTGKVFLNCNPYFVEGPEFERIKSIFQKRQFSVKNVVLEITERSSVINYDLFYQRLNMFREYGFQFAIDDVGGGYASLQSIVETHPEIIKIDRAIISHIEKDSFRRSIVESLIGFCRQNKITSIAEGIETKEDLQSVHLLGIDAAQGFYLARPSADLKHIMEQKVVPVV